MIDPFIGEKQKNKNMIHDIKESCDKLVYSESRYILDESPRIIYLPNIEIMFKIMRSCFGVTKIKDLWINNLN